MLSLFFCCHRRQPSEESLADEPNERSHLIPPSDQPEPVIPIEVDLKEAARARLHARMARVVKSKESKMVNITARLPFNLRSQDLGVTSVPSHIHDPSSSSISSPSPSPSPYTSHPPLTIPSPSNPPQNANGSLFAFADPSSTTPHSHGEVQAQVGGPLTAVGATAKLPGVVSRSPSRSSRVRELSSEALLSPGDVDEDAVGRDGERDGSSSSRARRVPLLGVRLLKGPPIDQIRPWSQVDSGTGSPNGKGKPSALRGSTTAGSSPSPSFLSLRGRAKHRGTSISSSVRGGLGTSGAVSGSPWRAGKLDVSETEDPELTVDTTIAIAANNNDGDEDAEIDTDLHTPTIGALVQTPRPEYFVSPPPPEASTDNHGSQRGTSPVLTEMDSTSSVDRGRTREPTPFVMKDTEPLIVDWED